MIASYVRLRRRHHSTTYYEPFHVARTFATLDLLLGGCAAWNVVTSLNDSEAANFGTTRHLEHDLRYDCADEFMEVVHGHWDSWDDGAIMQDRASGRFADPARVTQLDHKGKFFSSRGPFTVPRSRQGHPLIIQAGQSGRGRDFAARWAELIFVINPTLKVAQKNYAQMQEVMGKVDRPKSAILPAIYTIVGRTQFEAEDKRALIEGLAKPIDGLALLSEVLNYDFSVKKPDEPFTNEEMQSISGLRAFLDRVVQASGKANPTLEEWFTGKACDGFVVAGTHSPGTYEDFAELVTPELQRRGLLHKDYAGSTLRENLGMEVPMPGSWRM